MEGENVHSFPMTVEVLWPPSYICESLWGWQSNLKPTSQSLSCPCLLLAKEEEGQNWEGRGGATPWKCAELMGRVFHLSKDLSRDLCQLKKILLEPSNPSWYVYHIYITFLCPIIFLKCRCYNYACFIAKETEDRKFKLALIFFIQIPPLPPCQESYLGVGWSLNQDRSCSRSTNLLVAGEPFCRHTL